MRNTKSEWYKRATEVTRTQAQGLYTDNNPEFFKNL